MAAYLTTTFKRGFLLTEESLIKIDDLIRKRICEVDPESKITFNVFRKDGMLVEYESPGEVVKEENSLRNAVRRIDIVCEQGSVKLKLVFDEKESVDLEIESENRDLAYLLFSDIKEYLSTEVLKFRGFSFDAVLTSRQVLPLIAMLIPLFTLLALKESPKPDVVAQIIQSADVQQKLNYLIQQTVKKDEVGNLKYLIFVMFGIVLIPLMLGSMLDKAFPRNVFYWGKKVAPYNRLHSIREKVLWGVVIAFVIGIASTVAVDFFRKT